MIDRTILTERLLGLFSDYFKAVRDETEMTQKQYGELLQITDRQYRNIENGNRLPTIQTFVLFFMTLTEAGQQALISDLRLAAEYNEWLWENAEQKLLQ